MAIDKSLSQYQEDLLKGTTLGALRKAGVVSPQIPVQKIVMSDPTKITTQAPKVGDIKPAEEISFQPAAEIKTAPPLKFPTAKGLASFDQKKYSDLARAFYDQTAKQAMNDPNLEYVSKFLNRPYRPRTVDKAPTLTQEEIWDRDDIDPADRGTYLTSSLTSEKSTPTLEKIFAPLTQISNEGATSFSDNQIENIFKSDNEETKNLITNTIGKVYDEVKDNPFLKIGSDYLINTTLKNTVAKQLGIGSMFGPLGMLFGWAFDKVVSKITGKEPTGPINTLIDKAISKDEGDTVEDKIKKQEEIWEKDDVDPADQGFTATGTYGGNEVYSSDGSSVDSETGDITNADGTYGGNIVDEFVSEPAPAPAPAPAPTWDPSGGSDNGGGGGWSGSGGRSDDSWSSSPFLKGGRVKLTKGGRVDKALTGRSRDI